MRTYLRGKITLLFMTLGLLLAIPAVALADNLQDEITGDVNTGTQTITAGGSTDVDYWIVGNGSDGCNVDASNAATVTINTPTGVTASPSSLTFNKCQEGSNKNEQTVTFSSSTVSATGHTITTSASGGKSGNNGWNTTAAGFKLIVNAATPSDSTAPVINPNVVGTLGSNGWYTSDVALTWNVTDPESDVTSTTGCDDVSVTSDQNATEYTCSATSAGGTSSQTVSIKRDATAPTNIQFSGGGLTNGNTYDFGDVPAGPTGCTANGDISGLKSPGGCVLDNGYSTAVGPHEITATAEDNAGNTSEATLSYTVRSWTMTGFYQPVDMNGVYNTVKSGATVPLKFEVFKGASPNLTELTDTLSTIGGNSDVKVSTSTCEASAAFDDVETTVSGNTVLRYDTTSGQFVFNWQTPKNKAGSCYKVTIPTKDGVSSLTAYFKLK
jgi:hypothetical protein